MKKVIITQSNYIPWRGYFDEIQWADVFVLYEDVQYTRRDWRNRNKIKTAKGVQWLSIPVQVKGKYHQLIKDTKIADNKWNKKHWRTIQLNYAKASYFKQYKDALETLYMNRTETYLSEINRIFLSEICQLMGIEADFRWSWEFELKGDKTERLINICKQLNATDYYTGPSAKSYINEELFTQENINLHYFDFSDYPPYSQLHGEFIDHLSIIDLLLNEGPNAKKYMKTFSQLPFLLS